MSQFGTNDDSRPPSKELRRLVDGLLDESLTRVEFTQLEELLESDPQARSYYLEMMANEALISSSSADLNFTSSALEEKSSLWIRIGLGVSAAAALVIAYAAGVSQTSREPVTSHTLSPVTEVDDSGEFFEGVQIAGGVGVVWQRDASGIPLQFGTTLKSPELAIDSGILELTYANGVGVLLEGPARYRVTGLNSGELTYGNLVAEVPPGAEGFTVDFAGDRLVDHGTQFGVRLPKETRVPEVAVFRGEVEIFPGKNDISARLTRDHAVRRISSETGRLESIPLDRSLYARELPSRELPWKMPAVRVGEAIELEFDVSPLIRKSGTYFMIFKWMRGLDLLHISKVELFLDGLPVNADSHPGATGTFPLSKDNTYTIPVSEADFRPGKWTLKASVKCLDVRGTQRASDCQGILLVEEGGLVGVAELEDCVGRWDYWHDGLFWSRHLQADGAFSLFKEGELQTRGLWEARAGGLLMFFPREKIYERHQLRDANTLLFIDQPYRNALRREEE